MVKNKCCTIQPSWEIMGLDSAGPVDVGKEVGMSMVRVGVPLHTLEMRALNERSLAFATRGRSPGPCLEGAGVLLRRHLNGVTARVCADSAMDVVPRAGIA